MSRQPTSLKISSTSCPKAHFSEKANLITLAVSVRLQCQFTEKYINFGIRSCAKCFFLLRGELIETRIF